MSLEVSSISANDLKANINLKVQAGRDADGFVYKVTVTYEDDEDN
jgi:hypothetical protein